VPGSNPISLRFHRGFTGLVNLPLGASERHREMRDRRARSAISGAVIGEFVGTMVGTVLMVAWRGSTRRYGSSEQACWRDVARWCNA
jgi:hypothetical protein